MADDDKIGLASLVSFRRYLQLKGWREIDTRSDATTLFTLAVPGDDRLELPLPKRLDFKGADRLITEALRTLTQMGVNKTFQIVDDINSIGFDRIRSIIPDDLVRSDTIDLNIAGGFINNARKLLTTTATTELAPSAFFGRVMKEAVIYTERCRFGHTFRGSFGFTIESPIVQNDEPSLSVFDQPAPFERRVVQRLARGLHAILLAEKSRNPAIIADGFKDGFNANMCDALVDLAQETTERIKFEIAWSPEWTPSPDVQASSYAINPSTIEVIREAAVLLRRVDTATVRTIVGKVTRLKSEHNPSDLLDVSSPREIVIQWGTAEHGNLNVKVILEPADYIVAVEAHRSGQPVSISGLLERVGRTWMLSKPENLSLVS